MMLLTFLRITSDGTGLGVKCITGERTEAKAIPAVLPWWQVVGSHRLRQTNIIR